MFTCVFHQFGRKTDKIFQKLGKFSKFFQKLSKLAKFSKFWQKVGGSKNHYAFFGVKLGKNEWKTLFFLYFSLSGVKSESSGVNFILLGREIFFSFHFSLFSRWKRWKTLKTGWKQAENMIFTRVFGGKTVVFTPKNA